MSRRTGLLAAGLLLSVALITLWIRSYVSGPSEEAAITHVVGKTDLVVTVTERGNLESQKTVTGVCMLRGRQNKITFIVEEGTRVEEGDIVVRLDDSEVKKLIDEQEITVNQAKAEAEAAEQELEVRKNTNESSIAAAEMELKLAELDLKKYKEGDYLVRLNELKGKIALAESELEKSKDSYVHLQELVKSGYRQPEQLKGAKQQVESAQFNLRRDQETLRVLEKYEHERSLTEYEGKAVEAKRKLQRAHSTAKAELVKAEGNLQRKLAALRMHEQTLVEYRTQLDECVIEAPQSGIVAYSNREWYDASERIREGALVRQRQEIFQLPDMSQMQASVNVHESVVKKVKVGQVATIRVDAFVDEVLKGTVTKVSPLADSSRSWMRGGVKEYATIVTIDEIPDIPLRPGMTAEVEIKVGRYPDVLAIPVQGVTQHGREHFAYVQNGDDIERRPVEIGESNYKLVEIKSGLSSGDVVCLDARNRIQDDPTLKEIEDAAETADEEALADNSDDEESADEDQATSTAEVAVKAPGDAEEMTAAKEMVPVVAEADAGEASTVEAEAVGASGATAAE